MARMGTDVHRRDTENTDCLPRRNTKDERGLRTNEAVVWRHLLAGYFVNIRAGRVTIGVVVTARTATRTQQQPGEESRNDRESAHHPSLAARPLLVNPWSRGGSNAGSGVGRWRRGRSSFAKPATEGEATADKSRRRAERKSLARAGRCDSPQTHWSKCINVEM